MFVHGVAGVCCFIPGTLDDLVIRVVSSVLYSTREGEKGKINASWELSCSFFVVRAIDLSHTPCKEKFRGKCRSDHDLTTGFYFESFHNMYSYEVQVDETPSQSCKLLAMYQARIAIFA